MTETSDALNGQVLEAVRRSAFADALRDVRVEPAWDENGVEFLRVVLVLELPDHNVDSELEALLERIEEAVSSVDERYPSVRFLDAA